MEISNDTARPTYPDPMSAADINSALTMPYVAYVILGKGGVIAMLIMVFQAITSTLSSGTSPRKTGPAFAN